MNRNSTHFSKTAAAGTDIPLTPDEAYQASKMFGGSLFSAIQLSKELERIRAAKEQRSSVRDDVLRIPIPAELLPASRTKQASTLPPSGSSRRLVQKIAQDGAEASTGVIGRALKLNRHPVRLLAGGQNGFGDAQREFHAQEKAQIAKELQLAQQEYIRTLQQIKMGQETPHVDAYCSGMAENLMFGTQKQGADTAAEVGIADHSIRRLLGDAFNAAKRPFRPVTDAAATGLLSTGTSAAYLTYLLRKKMHEDPDKYMQEGLPTKVELVPFN